MSRLSEQEKLAKFSYRIFQIKFVIFESVLLLSFLYVLDKVMTYELGW